ncbi:chaperonin-containing T-complex member BBS12 [Mixophyes fleayi]|uniref:chaperonin-containing T-complex member BBS12 n=1 Tax=Mixophyes fleayi TaxID=3061075 RepID=UPI003F4E3AE0
MEEDGPQQGLASGLRSDRQVFFANNTVTARKIQVHVGLTELCNLSSPVKTFLGPLKCNKFIYDQDTHESTLTSTSFRLLDSLDLTSPVGQLLNETIQAHHKAYRTGTTTLFFLIGAWSNAVLECLHQGLPFSMIVSVMLEGLNSCIENLDSLHIHLNNITNQSSINKTTVRHVSTSDSDDRCAFKCSHPLSKSNKHRQLTEANVEDLNSGTDHTSRLSHSRYFSIQSRSYCQNTSTMPTSNHSLGALTKSLSHGSSEAMNLVEKAVSHLFDNAPDTFVTKDLFQASRLDVCFLRGKSEVHSNASFGYTTLVSLENAAIAKQLEGKPLQVLLLDGDLTEKYRHLGSNKANNLKYISEFNSEQRTSEDSWISSACRKIIQANADLILVRGDVCPLLMMHCVQRNILTIPHVKQNVLQAFSECAGADAVTYLTQINQHSVGRGVYVNICTKWSSVLESSQRIAINLKACRMNLVTVVLSCRLIPKMQVLEDQFWACSYRLHHALHDQKVFPGGGAVELLCLSHLRKLERNVPFNSDSRGQFSCKSSWVSTDAVHYKTSVFKCLAKGWYKYIYVLLCNMGKYSSELEAMTFIDNELQNIDDSFSPSSYILNEYSKNSGLVDNLGVATECREVMVYDNAVPKVEAWRSALHLVLTVLQSDAEIITGSTPQKQIIKRESVNAEYLFL